MYRVCICVRVVCYCKYRRAYLKCKTKMDKICKYSYIRIMVGTLFLNNHKYSQFVPIIQDTCPNLWCFFRVYSFS